MNSNLLVVLKDEDGTGLIFEPQITVEITSRQIITADTPEIWSQEPSICEGEWTMRSSDSFPSLNGDHLADLNSYESIAPN